MPTLRDPDRLIYEEEVGGLVVGGYEQSIAWALDGIPDLPFPAPRFELGPFQPMMERLLGRIPALKPQGSSN
jgi:hypothetical protein